VVGRPRPVIDEVADAADELLEEGLHFAQCCQASHTQNVTIASHNNTRQRQPLRVRNCGP
jgi:hypothetical protein